MSGTVIAIKEHILCAGTAPSVLAPLWSAGFSLVGARLVHLPSQPINSALLGLDSPLAPGPVLAVLIEGFEPTERVQAMAGAIDPKIARSTDVGSWRAKLGVDRTMNVVSTPRHAKGGLKAASYFFGPRHVAPTMISGALAAKTASLVLRQPRTCVLLLTNLATSPATAACALLTRMQHAGLSLHRAVRLDKTKRDALGVAPASNDDDRPRLAFLFSREGEPLPFATAALPSADGADDAALGAVVIACPHQIASALVVSAGPAPCALGDMIKYTLFTLKNELL